MGLLRYWAKKTVPDDTWKPPAVRRVEGWLGLRRLPEKRVSHIEERKLQEIPVMSVQPLHAMVAK